MQVRKVHATLPFILLIHTSQLTLLAGALKQLVQLSIQASKVTGVGVKKLVQGLPRLARLDISDCQDVGHDAVEWARKQRVKVGFSRSL